MRKRRNPDGVPAYVTLLLRHKLISPRDCDAYVQWVRVCESPEVIKRAQKYAARKRPDYLSGVGVGYLHAEKVLNAMKPSELAALKLSLGIKPEKEFAVK